MKNPSKIRHEQKDGVDYIYIYNPLGVCTLESSLEMEGEPLESAAGALIIGHEEIIKRDLWPGRDTIFSSNVSGAAARAIEILERGLRYE